MAKKKRYCSKRSGGLVKEAKKYEMVFKIESYGKVVILEKDRDEAIAVFAEMPPEELFKLIKVHKPKLLMAAVEAEFTADEEEE